MVGHVVVVVGQVRQVMGGGVVGHAAVVGQVGQVVGHSPGEGHVGQEQAEETE